MIEICFILSLSVSSAKLSPKEEKGIIEQLSKHIKKLLQRRPQYYNFRGGKMTHNRWYWTDFIHWEFATKWVHMKHQKTQISSVSW